MPDILLKFEQLGKQTLHNRTDIKVGFDYLKELFMTSAEPMARIGFRRKDEKD